MLKERVKETRSIRGSQLEIRQEGEGRPKIRGYAALFNVLSDDMGGWRERILPGAFRKSLEEPNDIKALWNHDSKYVLGRTPKTLRIGEDETGLWFEAEAPNTQWANDLIVSMQRGDVDEMSFGFRTETDRLVEVNDIVIRELVEVKLFEVSPVTFPAYPATNVHVRNLEGPVLDVKKEIQLLDNKMRWIHRA